MRRHAALIASAFVLAACNRAPAPTDALPEAAPATESATPAAASIPAPATSPGRAASATPRQPAPMPEGSYASYQCDDGEQVDVHFNGIAATVAWPDGRTAQLSQPTPVAEGEPQVYSDRNVRIERKGDGLHLRDGGNAETLCTETETSA
ncbi:MAG TPA: hypothetical protein VFI26_08610 [Lysobacter sp.]|nr:hypothetical protein [Lysobacter sp.]